MLFTENGSHKRLGYLAVCKGFRRNKKNLKSRSMIKKKTVNNEHNDKTEGQ